MDIVFELDEAAKRQLHSAPDWIPRCLEYLAAREIEKLRGLLREALDNLDHRDLNIRGSSLADRIEEVVTPNAKVSGAGTASAGLPGYTAGDYTE